MILIPNPLGVTVHIHGRYNLFKNISVEDMQKGWMNWQKGMLIQNTFPFFECRATGVSLDWNVS
jgi:hypothetical protein